MVISNLKRKSTAITVLQRAIVWSCPSIQSSIHNCTAIIAEWRATLKWVLRLEKCEKWPRHTHTHTHTHKHTHKHTETHTHTQTHTQIFILILSSNSMLLADRHKSVKAKSSLVLVASFHWTQSRRDCEAPSPAVAPFHTFQCLAPI